MSNVKIALRVRPLSERELSDETSLTSVVTVEDDRTATVTNLKVSLHHAGDSRERVKRFTFDHCFDSSSPGKENYATQENVFNSLGKIILESFARGQDACVLAYGQSASGKTHTMQGNEDNPGLAPRLCEAIYETSSEENSKLSISYFEIYNERVRDLLTNVQKLTSLDASDKEISSDGFLANQTKGLRVREHPRNGPYVEGLQEIRINKREHLSTLLKIGSSRRRTASTQRNPESSRSHAVLALKKGDPATSLTLLDLAGSERPSSVNQSISHQKEGSNINKSLVALSNVISALAEVNPRTSRYVPYRDSVLTWLLKDTLSGGTTTVMVATVSPSSSCYAETVNTMRWASRAGRIQAGASTANKTPKTAAQRSLRALRTEVARLRELLVNVAKEKIVKDPVQVTDQTTQVSFLITEDLRDANFQREDDVSESTIKEENTLIDENGEQEGGDSLNSLASSRLSVASNDTLSNPSTHGSTLHSGPTEDQLFGPRLNRTNSVHDIKPLPPLRNKNRQYSSHEGLANPERRPSKTPIVRLNKNVISRIGDKDKVDNFNSDNRRGDTFDEKSTSDSQKQHVPYEPFNKRAVIVASVTDRLYGNSKKKEDLEKMGSNRNINEPKLYNGSKKKLLDLSYRALRASRRFRVGVSTETQTENISSIRVKEIGTDIQNDIEPLPFIYDETGKKFCNASVETESKTLLVKEVSVETINGSIHSDDKSIATEKHDSFGSLTFTKTCGNMTDQNSTYSASTQTLEIPIPRKKYSSFTKYLKVKQESSTAESTCDRLSPKVFNISISHDCNQFENEGDSISDDSLECEIKPLDIKLQSHATPDLLNNHSSSENIASRNEGSCIVTTKSHNENSSQTLGEDYNGIDLDKNTNVNMGGLNANVKGIIYQNNSKATNSNIIKSKTGVNINDRCDRVTNTGGEVIKEHDVTWNILQPSVILNADTIKLNKNTSGDGKMNCENYHLCTSKSTQVDNSSEPQLLAEFLEDIYVPLPRICVTSDFNTDYWPSMRNIILGRNENSYPYNIKLSPKREDLGARKRSKSVTWKVDKHDKEGTSKITQRKTLLKRNHSSTRLGENHYATAPSVVNPFSVMEKDRTLEDFTYCDHKKYIPKSNFRGIGTWEDRIPYSTHFRIKSPDKDVSDYDSRYDATCVHYMNATSNLIKEAANLVASLSKEENKGNINKTGNNYSSPVCNDTLQNVDENKNSKNSVTVNNSEPSTSTQHFSIKYKNNNTKEPEVYPHFINEELICTEDDSDNTDTFEDIDGFSSDEDLRSLSKNIDEIQKDLLVSLDRLKDRTSKSKDYFQNLPKRYLENYNRTLTSIPNSFEGPKPFPRSKRNPSKYLEELLKIRKNLVECTKRDDYICKQFKKESP